MSEASGSKGDNKSEEVDEVCGGVVGVAKIARVVGLRWFRGEDGGGERRVEEAGLGGAKFVGEEGGSGFGGVGLRRTEGLDEVVGEGEETFGKVESAGDAETERVGWLRDSEFEGGGEPGGGNGRGGRFRVSRKASAWRLDGL